MRTNLRSSVTSIAPIARSVILGALLALLPSARASAQQLDLPFPSPHARAWQQVGLTEITVEYSCPGVKGRKIWGALVPYDKMWRTGANQATRITFSKDVTLADKPVPAGTYSLFTIPTKGDWTIILNKKAEQPGTMQEYKADQDLVRIQVKPKAAPLRERLAFVFSDFDDDKASLDLEWEKLRVSIPIKVATGPQALANIKTALDGTWRTYANAARYMLETKKDYDAGLKYIDQSLALKEDWFNVWIKASLLAAKGNYKDAYPVAEKAYALGQKAEVFFLEPEVKKALGEWKKKT
jgi:tetratricopeptide (TPR) repeat protein